MRITHLAPVAQKSIPALLIGGAGSLISLAATGGPEALVWAAIALVVLAAVLSLTEQVLGHQRAVREIERGAARDRAAAMLGEATAAGKMTPAEAVAVLDAQSRRETVVAGPADAAELAKLVRALTPPAPRPARPRQAGGSLSRATRHDPR